MTPVEVLREIVSRGVGIAPAGAGVGVYLPPRSASDWSLTPQLRADVSRCKAALLRLVDEAAVRKAWRIPDVVILTPQVCTIAAWLLAERITFSRVDWREWLGRKTMLIAAGSPRHVADLLATEEIARKRLAADAVPPTVYLGEVA
jgi:hypothetical protein